MFGKKSTTPFDTVSPWQWQLRKLRNLIVIVLLAVLAAHLYGVPYLRVTYRYRETYSQKTITSATYYGVTGRKDVVAGEYGEGCPLILMIPVERSLYDRITSALTP